MGLFRARLAFPLDIEWMESGHIYHAYRLSHHLPLYTNPERGFAAFPYPPLYWVAIAAVGRVFGLDYWTGRAVSVASIAGCAIILGTLLVRRAPPALILGARSIGVAFAIMAAASIGAAYPIGGASFDLARADAFATFMAVAAAAVAGDGVSRPSIRRALATAALLTMAIYAKQTGVFFAIWILGFMLRRDLRTGALVAVTTGVACGLLLAILNINSGGWFWTWIVDMQHHGMMYGAWADPLSEFVRHAPFLVILPPLVAFLAWRKSLRPETAKWVGVLGAAIVGALISHLKVGGWLNVYTPALVLAWPVSLLVMCDLLRLFSSHKHAPKMGWALLAVCSVVLFFLRYNATPFTPTPRMWSGARDFDAFVAQLDGDVVVATNPFAAVRAGKRCDQPILQAYVDGQNAGMKLDYVASLVTTRTVWVIVTGTWLERGLDEKLQREFDFVREVDLYLDSPRVDHESPRTLWRRRQRL